jgi:Insertion element 4 transposase N-terminal/Transposase DDE domain
LPAHSATSWGWLSPRGRVLARCGIGVLSFVVAPDLVDAAVGDGLAWEMRLRALPSRLGVYFILGLCLFSHDPYGEVVRSMVSGLETVLGGLGWQVPASTALTGVRRRIGEKPLESLFGMLGGAYSPGRAPWSHICGLLVAGIDGTTADARDTAPNAAAFGRPAAAAKKRGPEDAGTGKDAEGAYPQLRLVVLMACGTRALLAAAMGPARGKGTGERALAARLLGSLHQGMLLLADRGFYSYRLWTAAAGTGAQLLWRMGNGRHLPVVRELPDGSWITRVPDPAQVRRRIARNGSRRRRGSALPPDTGPLPGITVRVIAFTVTVETGDGTVRTEPYRLLTTLLDWRAFPAAELAAGYARRWAVETGYREIKTYLRGARRVLRGETPDLARQELWAYLCVYQAIRVLIARAAARDQIDPARISFTAALHAARRSITLARDDMTAALGQAEAETLRDLLPERQARICPRAVKKPRSPYPSRTASTPLAQHATCTITPATAATSARTLSDQREQTRNTAKSPP